MSSASSLSSASLMVEGSLSHRSNSHISAPGLAAWVYWPFEVCLENCFLWFLGLGSTSGSCPGVWTQSRARRLDFALPGKLLTRTAGQRERLDHSTCRLVPWVPVEEVCPGSLCCALQGDCPSIPAGEKALAFWHHSLPLHLRAGSPAGALAPLPPTGLT